MPKRATHRVEWCLHEVMAKRGITHWTSLQVLLKRHGIEPSDSSVKRMFSTKDPKNLDLELIGALMQGLNCSAGALFKMKKVLRVVEPVAPSQGKHSTEPELNPAKSPKKKVVPLKPPQSGTMKTQRPVFSLASNISKFPGKNRE